MKVDWSLVDWSLLVPLVVTSAFSIVGYYVAHRLSAARDRANKRRELRTQYLIDAFCALVDLHAYNKVSERPAEVARAAERALSVIQLFGSERQIQLYEKNRLNHDLINDFKNELRQILKLKPSDKPVIWHRFEYEAWRHAPVPRTDDQEDV